MKKTRKTSEYIYICYNPKTANITITLSNINKDLLRDFR